MKTCSRCHEERPDDWYAKHSVSKRTGLQLYKTYCRICKSANTRKDRAERRTGKKTCVKCREVLDISAFRSSDNGLRKACQACEALESRCCKVCHIVKGLDAYRKNGWGGFRQECYSCEGESKRSDRGKALALRLYHAKAASDPIFRIKQNLRSATRRIFKGMTKDSHTFDLLGCSPEDYQAYLTSKFQEGMTMENYGKGGWSIDHITPLASFDIYNPAERARAFHYTNTQPMWEADNLSKCDKLPDGTLGRFLRPKPPQAPSSSLLGDKLADPGAAL